MNQHYKQSKLNLERLLEIIYVVVLILSSG